jgi:hypothetical protein
MFASDMVCLRNISVDTLHKGGTEDDDDNDDNNNNNPNNNNNNNNNNKVRLHRRLIPLTPFLSTQPLPLLL